jgi:DegV family protein with EDD domain
MSVLVVSDSAASLPPEAVERFGVVVVPMTLVLGGVVYADGDLTAEEVVTRAATEPVSTSAPSPGAFLKAIASAVDERGTVDEVVVLTVSSRMSASYQVAQVAARYADDTDIRVIDTGTAAGAQALVVLGAAEAAARGASLDEVCRRAEDVASRVRLVASLRSLDYLARSGRVPQAAAWAGRSLGVQIMFEFARGGVKPRRPARNHRGALERMVGGLVEARSTGGGHTGDVLRAAVLHAQAPDSASALSALVRQAVPGAELFEAPFSSVMVAHTGPNLVGLAWWWEGRPSVDRQAPPPPRQVSPTDVEHPR